MGTSEAHQHARMTMEHDLARDRYLKRRGILTLRVPARDVLDNVQGVMNLITETARARPRQH